MDRVTVQRNGFEAVTLKLKSRVQLDPEIEIYTTTRVVSCALPVDEAERFGWGQERKAWREERRQLNRALDACRKQNKMLHKQFGVLKATSARAVSRAQANAEYALAMFSDRMHTMTRRVKQTQGDKRSKAASAATTLAAAKLQLAELNVTISKLRQENVSLVAASEKIEQRLGSQRGVIAELHAGHKADMEAEATRVKEAVELEAQEQMRAGLEQVVEAAREGYEALNGTCDSLTDELALMRAKLQAQAEESKSELEAVTKGYQSEMSKLQPPAERSQAQWDSLKSEAERKARYRDMQFLSKIFESRTWRPEDVADVLAESGYLGSIFDSSKSMWPMKMQFLRDSIALLYKDTWTDRLALHLKIDLLLSKRNLEHLRHLLAFDYNRLTDNYVRRILLESPVDASDVCLYPCPIVSYHKWHDKWMELKATFDLKVDKNGDIVRKTLVACLKALLDRDEPLMPPLSSFTEDWPWRPCIQYDATGLYHFKLCHYAVKNTSYLATAHNSSECKLETLAVTHGGDEHDAAVEVLGPIVPAPGQPPSIASEIAAIESAGVFEFKGVCIPCRINFSADLKGVEGGEGFGPLLPLVLL